MEGNCLITRGLCCGRGNEQCLKYFDEAHSLLIQNGGNISLPLKRLYYNYGACHYYLDNDKKAYENFKKHFELCIELNGYKHQNTIEIAAFILRNWEDYKQFEKDENLLKLYEQIANNQN